jgi:hypothetical protein
METQTGHAGTVVPPARYLPPGEPELFVAGRNSLLSDYALSVP